MKKRSKNSKKRRRNPEAQVCRAVQRCRADRDWQELLPGGTTRHPSEFDYDALVRGTLMELEHTVDPCIAMEIAMDHLDEDPRYYEPHPRRSNPDSSGCVLAKHAWDKDLSACGSGHPSPSQAARDLAKKRWTLSPREARIKAALLR